MIQRRNTKQRQMVLRAVLARDDHPSADQIYLDVRAQDDKISRGTVYRNLKLLEESGDILHVKVPNADRYDWRSDAHYHVICTRCGAVRDAAMAYRADLDEQAGAQTGYDITHHITVFEGLCPDCQGPEGEA